MNKYQNELQSLKPWDEVQGITLVKGYQFIETAGHGYLVVPCDDVNYETARAMAEYGFCGVYAVYLEEDSEAPKFIESLGHSKDYDGLVPSEAFEVEDSNETAEMWLSMFGSSS